MELECLRVEGGGPLEDVDLVEDLVRSYLYDHHFTRCVPPSPVLHATRQEGPVLMVASCLHFFNTVSNLQWPPSLNVCMSVRTHVRVVCVGQYQ